MGHKKLVLAGAALATMTMGFTAPAVAATAFAATRAVPTAVTPSAHFQVTSARGEDDDDSADVSGLQQESPVCSALGTETIPTGDEVAKCLNGTSLE
jgi:hypothetical protein